ncbi:MAG: GntR family transcriptional regulator [Anaerolineaceae bacterium]|nr:GntR family transcriptional regulator [Anaerolineaceae bacterium]
MFEKIKINFQTKEPIYFQIEEQIKFLITSEKILPGEQLPTVRELAEQLDVNFNTIARVYRLLDKQGLVSSQRGRGCYVVPRDVPLETQHAEMLAELTASYIRQCGELGFKKIEIRDYFLKKLEQ